MTRGTAVDRAQPVRRSVPGGWLHVDRLLPFLCAYRRPTDGPADGTERLVVAQAAHLLCDAGGAPATVGGLVRDLAEQATAAFGAFLLLEVWSTPPASDGPPTLDIHTPATGPDATVEALADALGRVEVAGHGLGVRLLHDQPPAPPGCPPLLDGSTARRLGSVRLGLAVSPVFVDPDSGTRFPLVLRSLEEQLGRALRETFFAFSQVQTTFRPDDFRALGRRTVGDADLEADRRLAEASGELDHVLLATPVDVEEAWRAFEEAGHEGDPVFHYRPLPVDPDLLKRRLYDIRLEHVEDPVLGGLFRAKRRELDLRLKMAEDRDTPAFLHTSLELYGGVDEALVDLARRVLAALDALPPTESGPSVDATAFATRVQAELDRYRRQHPGMDSGVELRDDLPGVITSQGRVLVGRALTVSAARLEALVHHEVGAHVLTWVNGGAQPLQLLRVGLPGFEEAQEGLAVLVEHLVGELRPSRLRVLAARVVAVHSLLDGATFTETYRAVRHVGLAVHPAFLVTMRVHRGGGLTKDAIYLRGLEAVLRHLGGGGDVEPLLVGKLPLEYVPVVEELRWRGLLRPPVLRPHWLDIPAARLALERVVAGVSVVDLVPGA